MKYKDTSRTYTCILCRFFILEVTQNGYRKNPEEQTCLKYSLLYLIHHRNCRTLERKLLCRAKIEIKECIQMKISGKNLNYLEL